MLNSAKIIPFLPVSDAEKAKRFYGDLLGLPLVAEGPYEIIFDSNGTMLHLLTASQPAIAAQTVCGWEVADICAEVHALVAKGVAFERYEGMEQDEDAICTFPDGDQFAWFKDPDSNILSLAQLNRAE